ncbi:hypothetical protein B0T20DRAFT_396716 [Sordaria brevicollis]|uniref:Uncharacterized protein n=1 Tax=Sordaria brevicollis TaxID=83679 RepID=A0AAE0U5T1_SORBR|nr:hypothetical protein B0T20DRAFT_396716 [Sordaria brevicollis]
MKEKLEGKGSYNFIFERGYIGANGSVIIIRGTERGIILIYNDGGREGIFIIIYCGFFIILLPGEGININGSIIVRVRDNLLTAAKKGSGLIASINSSVGLGGKEVIYNIKKKIIFLFIWEGLSETDSDFNYLILTFGYAITERIRLIQLGRIYIKGIEEPSMNKYPFFSVSNVNIFINRYTYVRVFLKPIYTTVNYSKFRKEFANKRGKSALYILPGKLRKELYSCGSYYGCGYYYIYNYYYDYIWNGYNCGYDYNRGRMYEFTLDEFAGGYSGIKNRYSIIFNYIYIIKVVSEGIKSTDLITFKTNLIFINVRNRFKEA